MSELAENASLDDLLGVRVQRTFDAPRQQVYAALTDPALLVKWWGPAGWQSDWAEVDLQPGGAYRINMRDLEGDYEGIICGTYTEISPPEHLVFEITEHCNGAPELFDATKLAPTTVAIHLRELGPGCTELTLTHTGFNNPVAADAHDMGWNSSFGKLADAFAEIP